MAEHQGHITNVYEKQSREHQPTGFYVIETDPPLKPPIETKIKEKAQEARGFMESKALVLIDYTESQGNQKQDGSYFLNRYYEKAGSLAAPSNGASEIPLGPVPPSTRGYDDDPAKVWRIALSVGAKLAVDTMPMMPTEQRTFEAQKRIAYAWAEWLISTQSPSQEADDIPY
jgi:hypothetical protein